MLGLLAVPAGLGFLALRLPPDVLREMLRRWEFWLLEALFACVAVTTLVEAKRLPITRRLALWAAVVGAAATLLTASVAPRTNRIFYDEQIYQGVAQNLTDLHLAQMCNDGTLESGRLQCWQGEFNKEPNGYPYLLSLVYRIAGVRADAAFYFNNLVAGLTAFLVVVLSQLLFADTRGAVLSGLVLALLPMQLWWTNTASAEPSAALMTAAALIAAVHFARVRTTSALAWTVAVTAFATTLRPESVLALPLVAVAVLLLAPGELRRRRIWWAAAAGASLCLPTVLHLMSVRHETWGAPAARFGWQYVKTNLPLNSWFYLGHDERFPVLIALAAFLGLVGSRHARLEALLLGMYFLSFWGVFVPFYAGSYYYGADVRFSLLSHVPLVLLAGMGLTRAADVLSRWCSRRTALAAVVVATLVQFSWSLPVSRSVGEEAWAARADVTYAKRFSQLLPPHSVVLTHNPSLFHVWGISAAQMSLGLTVPGYVREQLFNRYAGGVYLQWGFWCNVDDPVQTTFCRSMLNGFQSEQIASARERSYQYRLYRLVRSESPERPGLVSQPGAK